ncbi:winged helix-turn-helix domain-containing protein [Siphonobacter sp. SORGH_AS_1065]|uniref:winged helix-turn-helix domain-containing protein n=1 Tax=Siphonobacter sp. SORGH_AS_1065 TaxID=3041795 RepID=UPI002780FF3A|nr:LysR family transcriptional regulator [Siphonobacter sp. SORGH_AS_1065]MDQ1088709.1 molybdate transport system regulatory protein [Siphonobacter sp. SORGH_AS_1065]
MAFKVNGRIWIEGEERFMGIGRLELLQRIEQTGSISAAAKGMGMSYKRAWDLIQSLNNQAASPVVSTQTGGERGGGALITPEGKRWINLYMELQERFQAFVEQESSKLTLE